MEQSGILLGKVNYGERHLICRFLLENDQQKSFLFLGGRGGGKKLKVHGLEIGNVIKFSGNHRKAKEYGLETIKEWRTHWEHEQIKKSHHNFYRLCFVCELTEKIGVHEVYDNQKALIYPLLANFIFYLDQESDKVVGIKLLAVFLAKLIFLNGLQPQLKACLHCSEPLELKTVKGFEREEGGFVCGSCVSESSSQLKFSELYHFFSLAKSKHFKEFHSFDLYSNESLKLATQYLLLQFNLDLRKIKTSSFLFL
jgi:DNA repair protein RecO